VHKLALVGIVIVLLFSLQAKAQSSAYPKEMRGYKVEQAVVELKKTGNPNNDTLVRFGDAQLARVTPLGITFEMPLVIAPVKEKGHVDFLVFEEMAVNDTPIEIDDYYRGFNLPNTDSVKLREPLRIFVSLPSAVIAALDAQSTEKKTWIVTGRVYVFGRFRKNLFTFKRCIPVELNVSMPNPLRG